MAFEVNADGCVTDGQGRACAAVRQVEMEREVVAERGLAVDPGLHGRQGAEAVGGAGRFQTRLSPGVGGRPQGVGARPRGGQAFEKV